MLKRNILAAALASLLIMPAASLPAFAEDDWTNEFELICGSSDQASQLPKEELKSMVERCDKLKPVIESSGNTQKKVYLFRLEKCRKLFVFMLES